MVNGKLLELP